MTMSAAPRRLSDRLLSVASARRNRRTRVVVGAGALTALIGLGTVGVALGDGATPVVISVENVATSTISTTSTMFSAPPPAPEPPPAPAGPSPASSTAASTSATPSTSATTSTSTTPPAPPTPTPLDELYGVLPRGYSATLCGPSATAVPRALATVDCGQLSQPDAPTSARFSLFADANALASQFQAGVNDNAVSQCPGSIDSPRSWHYDATPAFSAGSLVCGTHDNVPALMWTKNDALLLGDVRGSSLDNLYAWWLSLG